VLQGLELALDGVTAFQLGYVYYIGRKKTFQYRVRFVKRLEFLIGIMLA
jgi:hypothetical protein